MREHLTQAFLDAGNSWRGTNDYAGPPTVAGVPVLYGQQFDPNAIASGDSTVSRVIATAAAGIATGKVFFSYFTATKTETCTQVYLLTTNTAGVTLTLCRVGIYSVAANGDLALIASTANDATLFLTANTAYAKAFSGGNLSKVAGVRYAVGILVVGTTMPTLLGAVAPTGSITTVTMGRAPRLAGALAAQADLPSTLVAGSVALSGTPIYTEVLP